MNFATGKFLSWDQFWSSFSVYASILDLNAHVIGTLHYWSEIPLQKCGEQEWAKALPDTDKSKNAVLEYGICLNPLKMVKSKLSQFKETFPIRGGNNDGSQTVMIDIYQCLPGRAIITKGVPTTCDTQWFGSALAMYAYDKTVNVKNYEEPIGSAHVRIDGIVAAKTLRFEAKLDIK